MQTNKIIKILPIQCKSARAMLNWSQEELALKVECAKKTITDFEKGHRTPHHRTLKEIKIIFEEAGIRFIDSDGIGVKLMDKNT